MRALSPLTRDNELGRRIPDNVDIESNSKSLVVQRTNDQCDLISNDKREEQIGDEVLAVRVKVNCRD